MFYFLLDAGHGDVVADHYMTPGKRSPEVPPGLFEGGYNHQICRATCNLYFPEIGQPPAHMPAGLNAIAINPGPINIPLVRKKGQGGQCRVEFINDFARRERQTAVISIHVNAAGKPGWSSGRGFTIFHSRRASEASKRLARIAEEQMGKTGIGIPSRGIKVANHTITTRTTCPAILIELGFMTNKEDVYILNKKETKLALCTCNARIMRTFFDGV